VGTGVTLVASAKFLLDTNIIIGIDNGTAAASALLKENNVLVGDCAISQITRMETLGFQGLTTEAETRIKLLIGSVHVLQLDEIIEQETIALRRRVSLRLPDAIIVATARI
jgi:toxin FitB